MLWNFLPFQRTRFFQEQPRYRRCSVPKGKYGSRFKNIQDRYLQFMANKKWDSRSIPLIIEVNEIYSPLKQLSKMSTTFMENSQTLHPISHSCATLNNISLKLSINRLMRFFCCPEVSALPAFHGKLSSDNRRLYMQKLTKTYNF